MPRKSMAARPKAVSESAKRISRPETQTPVTTRSLRSRTSSNSNNPTKRRRVEYCSPRSPVLTRSRSRSLALQKEHSDSLMDCEPPSDASLKRKHSKNQESGKSQGESSIGIPKKQKNAGDKKPIKSTMNNLPSNGKGKVQNPKADVKNASGRQNPEGACNNQNIDHSQSSSSRTENTPGSSSRILDALIAAEELNNLNEGNDTLMNANLAAFSATSLAASAERLNSEISEEISKNHKLITVRTDRNFITKSELQRSLLTAMQKSKSKKNSDNQSEGASGSSSLSSSDFPSMLKIRIEKGDGSKEQCKFNKSSNLKDGAQQNFAKPSGSAEAQGSAFHTLPSSKDMEIINVEEYNNPFLTTRRLFVPDNKDAADGDSASGGNSSSSTSPAVVGESDIMTGEIGRLQALMESRRIPLSLFGALESRMQHLFQKSMGTATSSRAQQLLQELQAAEDDEHQLQVLIELSQLLVMGNEDTLIGFPVKQLVPLLIVFLSKEYNFELMNQACRALTYLMEALPRSSSVIVEAIPVLLNKVQVIQCIDVAEQALTALKMLSKWHSKAILQSKGVEACLLYLEFFSINAQRTALAIIANCCQNILPHEFNMIEGSLPVLSARLTHPDEKSVESICLIFSGLVECFQNDPTRLVQIGSHSLLSNIQQLLVLSPPIISSQIFTGVIHMLALMCSASSEIVVYLLKQNFAETLQYLLVGPSDRAKSIELVSRSPQELFELSYLICEIMPNLPLDGIFSIDNLIVEAKKKVTPHNSVIWQWKDESGFWHSHDKTDSKNIEEAYQRGNVKIYISDRAALNIDLHSMEQFDEDGAGTSRPLRRHVSNSAEDRSRNSRGDFYEANAELITSSIKVLFPVLYEIYCSSAGSVKRKCLRAMLRMIYFASPDVLKSVLKNQSIARHIASMLASPDLRVVISALQLADNLMQKLYADFKVHFIREGVMHEMKNLSKIDAKTWQIEPVIDINAPSTSHSVTSQTSTTDDGAHASTSSHASKLDTHLPNQNSSAISFSMFGNALSPSAILKEEEGNSTNVASKIRDALKRRYMHIKRTFSAGGKDTGALCGAEVKITVESRVKINMWVRDQAHAFDEKYFSNDVMNSHPVINILGTLSNAITTLENMDDCGLYSLQDICDIVTKNDVSSFELIHSGLVKKLTLYLSAPRGESLPFGNHELHTRLRTFLHVFARYPRQTRTELVIDNVNPAPLLNLVTKLNACVSHLEQFPVKVYDHPSSGNIGRPGSSIMKFFNMHQLKCLFQRHPDCTNLRQWHGGPVMIDPLASIHNVDRYLANQGYSTVRNDDESESDLSYDDSSEDDGDMVVADIRMDHGQGSPKLQFLIGKNVLPYNITLYQAVLQYGNGENQSSNEPNMDCDLPPGYASIWLKTHILLYRPIPPDESGCSTSDANASQNSSSKKKSSSSRHSSKGSSSDKSKSSKSKKDYLWDHGVVPEPAFPSTFKSKLSGFDSIKDPSLEVIQLLRIVHGLSYHWGLLYQQTSCTPIIPQAEFVNNELTLKVNRQLQDPLAIMTGNTPVWLSHIAYNFPFLFPFETRHLLFYVTTFDRERALQRLLDTVPDLTTNDKVAPRLEKRKRAVSRSSLLKQAEAILTDFGSSKALLEVSYKLEAGTGLGPTLEFYALVSKELQKADLDMWHAVEVVTDSEKEHPTNYINSPCGLFPMPLPRASRGSALTKVCNKFKLLGRFMAKAIMDFRLVDIPLSLAFYKWMLNQESFLSIGDLKHVDESLAKQMAKFEQIVCRKKKLENDKSLDSSSLKKALEEITFDNCPISELSLDFTLPGYSRIEMKRGGKDVTVTIHNLEEYLKVVKHWMMHEGITRQMRSFREGFEAVFPISRLQVFFPDELNYLFCGSIQNQWDFKTLIESCRPDHGYTQDSQAIKFLFEILCNYSPLQQRQFIQFITGSPRLPIGGLKALSPPLTIVRKTADDEVSEDNYLPSVMTCVNYLKLPDYSSIELMQEKLQVAINEGQHSFHLS